MHKQQKKQAYNQAFTAQFAIMFAAFLWALDGVVIRPMLYHIDVSIVVFAEHFIAFIIMLPLLFYELKRAKILDTLFCLLKKPFLAGSAYKSRGRAFKGFADVRSYLFSVLWVSLFGGVIGTMAITKALFYVGYVPLSIPILLQKLQPVFAIAIARIALKEKPKKNFYLWASVAIASSYVVSFGFSMPSFSFGNKLLSAALLGLLAAFAWGSSTVFGRKALKFSSYKLTSCLRFGFTSAIMLIILFATSKIGKLQQLGPKEISLFVLIAVTTGGLAMLVYYFGLRKVEASKATLYELVFPISAVVLDYLINGTLLSVSQLLGAFVLLYSISRISAKP